MSTLAITITTTRIVSEDIIRKLKPCLPHLEKFDGSELSFFPQFEGLLKVKLEIDGPVIGQEKERV
jgi:hypothetical protein